MAETKNYDWKYTVTGGATRVSIESGQDIANLDQLDQKQWTVLSCPVKGLELDEKSLAYMDADADGKIHVNDVIATSKWLTSVLKNPDDLLLQEDHIAVESFNQESEQGLKLYKSSKQILANLGLKKNSISVADSSDSIAIFAKTQFNGDGIITEASTEDAELKKIIAACIASVGGVADRSGAQGVGEEQITKFYTALGDFAAWKKAAEDGKDSIFPFGDNTEAALAALEAVKPKADDFFMRCKLASFSAESASVLDVSQERIGSISGKNLAECVGEIEAYPLAHVSAAGELPLNQGINPAWTAAVAAMAGLVFKGKKVIKEADWLEAQAKFDAFKAWRDSKKGTEVEPLGMDAIAEMLKNNREAELLELVAKDKALEAEANSIDEVDKLLHLYRDFYKLLRNFVTFTDFYSRDENNLAVFQSGRLYIDQRCCDLCIKVPDMGPHNATAGLSGMYIMYCNCTNKAGQAMTIAAVLTDGDISNLREGKHGIFYDRAGLDWDATIVKIIENPISVRQAFWSPYRKLGRFIEDKISKNADAKDAKVVGDLTAKADAPAGAAKQPFDIAKFAGIGAMVTVALAAVGGMFAAIIAAVAGLPWWAWFIIIAAILLVISGPAMIKAWIKLRKRNLSPLLNANGWAVNSKSLVNIRFGATLTSVAKYPKGIRANDPYADKHCFRNWLIGILCAAVVAFFVLFFLGKFKFSPFYKAPEAAVEQVMDCAGCENEGACPDEAAEADAPAEAEPAPAPAAE